VRKNKKREINGKFIPITFHLLESEAWKNLSKNAQWLYPYIAKEQVKARYRKTSDDVFSFEYGKVKGKISRPWFYKVRQELIENGFFEVIELGGLFHKATKFKASEKWKSLSIEQKEKQNRKAQSTKDKAKVKAEKDKVSIKMDGIFERE